MDLFRTPPEIVPATSPSPIVSEPAYGAPATVARSRTCSVCGKPIKGRAEKRHCSGKCRIIACRQRRHAALLNSLAQAEQALAAATGAVEALRQIAAQGPHATASLSVGGGRS
jgi:predicted nucleic acid-binding Zn ribbon protein